MQSCLPGCRALRAAAPRLPALQQALPQPLCPASFRVLHARSLALYSCAAAVSSLPDPSQESELLLAATQLLTGHLLPWQRVAHLASLARQGAAMDDATRLAVRAAASQTLALHRTCSALLNTIAVVALERRQPEPALDMLDAASSLADIATAWPGPGALGDGVALQQRLPRLMQFRS